MSFCYIAPKAAPAGVLMKDESWVAARLLRKKETRVDSYYLLLNGVRRCIWSFIFKQLPALHALFMGLYHVTYTEVICIHQQTIFTAAQEIISYIHSDTIPVVRCAFLLLLLTTVTSNEFGQHVGAALGN